jgi:hypothetical protein
LIYNPGEHAGGSSISLSRQRRFNHREDWERAGNFFIEPASQGWLLAAMSQAAALFKNLQKNNFTQS